MAEGGLQIELGVALSERLKEAAGKAGQPAHAYVEAILADSLDAEAPDDDWAEQEARWAEYERSGETIPAEVGLAGFQESLARRFAARN